VEEEVAVAVEVEVAENGLPRQDQTSQRSKVISKRRRVEDPTHETNSLPLSSSSFPPSISEPGDESSPSSLSSEAQIPRLLVALIQSIASNLIEHEPKGKTRQSTPPLPFSPLSLSPLHLPI